MNDNYKEQIIALHEKQSAKGFTKYGQAMEQSELDITERLEYLAEELMDGLHYVFSVMEKRTPKSCLNCVNVGRPCYADPCASCENKNKWKSKEGD